METTVSNPSGADGEYKCADCGALLDYVPTDPQCVCKKCFDEWNGLTIDQIIGDESSTDSREKS